MKSFILLFLFSLTAQAGGITCFVVPQYSRFWIKWDDKTVSVEVENPRGVKSMPQMEAPFAEEHIPTLQFQAKELESLPNRFTYRWPKEKCDFSPTDKWLVSCHGKARSEPESKVEAMSFTTARIEESSLSGEFSQLRLRFIFSAGSMFFSALPFPLQKCSVVD